MTSRNPSRRLERLETRLMPTSEERILTLKFISADGKVAHAEELKLFAGPPPVKSKRRWGRSNRGVKPLPAVQT